MILFTNVYVQNVTRVTEWRTTPLEYLAEYKKFLDRIKAIDKILKCPAL
jgi:hypothetical protein